MNKTTTLLAILIALTAQSVHAQSQSGNALPDNDYIQLVAGYSTYLPDCSAPPSNSPLEWINQIEFVLAQSLSDAERMFVARPSRAYLNLKAALDAVSDRTTGCRDLRSMLARPVAEQTLKSIQILETTLNTNSELTKATLLYEFSRRSVLLTRMAATTVDRNYSVPYRDCWNPRGGFFDGDTTCGRLPRDSRSNFAQQLLNISAETLRLINSLGSYNTSGIFVSFYGTKEAFMPIALQLVVGVTESIRTNLMIMSQDRAYIRLEMLKRTIEQYMSAPTQSISFPMQVIDIQREMNRVADELSSCPLFRN